MSTVAPFEHGIRLLLEVISAIRGAWPASAPLFVRISATDRVQDGWTLDDSVNLAKRLKDCGVDLVDCSSLFVEKSVGSRCAGVNDRGHPGSERQAGGNSQG